jgi:hypothetical protein
MCVVSDISLENILLVSSQGASHVKIVDFGCACFIEPTEDTYIDSRFMGKIGKIKYIFVVITSIPNGFHFTFQLTVPQNRYQNLSIPLSQTCFKSDVSYTVC